VAAYDSVRFARSLTENVVFAQHNLTMDRHVRNPGAWAQESIGFTRFADRYEEIDSDERIYRKVA
jgi:hypothetical protein